MFKEIKISFTWDKKLAIKASKLYYDWDMRNSSKRYIGWLFIALTQFAIVGALKHNAYGLLYISTFLVVYWYYGRWYLRQQMIQRFYKKSNIDNTKVTLFLKNDGLHYNDSIIEFDNIKKVLEIDEAIIVQTDSMPLFLTKDAFVNYESLHQFLNIMREKGK